MGVLGANRFMEGWMRGKRWARIGLPEGVEIEIEN